MQFFTALISNMKTKLLDNILYKGV